LEGRSWEAGSAHSYGAIMVVAAPRSVSPIHAVYERGLIPGHTSKLKADNERNQERRHDVREPVSSVEASYLSGT